MSIVNRLEKGLEFLKGHEWGQAADRQPCPESPDGFSYCAQGAVAYGGFSDAKDEVFCSYYARFHPGPCDLDEDGECFNRACGPVNDEFTAVIETLTVVAREKFDVPSWLGVTWYNDAASRTKDDVIALFEMAIEQARKGASEDV